MALGSLLAKVGLGKKKKKTGEDGEEDTEDADDAPAAGKTEKAKKAKKAKKAEDADDAPVAGKTEKAKRAKKAKKAAADDAPAAGKTEKAKKADDADADDSEAPEGAEASSWKDKLRKLPKPALIGAVAGGGVLIVGLIGGGLWWAFAGKSEKGMAIAQAPARPGAALPAGGLNPPKGGGNLNEVARGGDEAPATPAAAAGGGAAPPPGPAAGSLNAATQAAQGPGAGIVVAAATQAAFSRLPDTAPGQPLSSAPDPQLIEQGAQGALPKIGKDGRKPWQVYGRPADSRDDRPRIAVIVAGMGLSRAATMAAIGKLPAGVTLAFDPYASDLNEWMIRARRVGHEVFVALPMESSRFPQEDAGPHALQTDAKPEENVKRLEFVLSRFGGYVGAVSVMGSKFKASEEQLRAVFTALKARGLMFVDGGDTEGSVAPKVAREVGVPRAASEVYIDAHTPRAAIDLKFTEVESLARQRSVTVLTVEANPANLERLASWLPTLEGKRMALTSVSSIADKQPSP